MKLIKGHFQFASDYSTLIYRKALIFKTLIYIYIYII